jgi:superfamily II DNA or RNA helicase
MSSPMTSSLRILLPPNLAAAAARDAIALKIEGAPEEVPAPLAAVCRGRSPWLLQASRAELRVLLHLLAGQPAFVWASRPREVLVWEGEQLPGVSEHLVAPLVAPPSGAVTPSMVPGAPARADRVATAVTKLEVEARSPSSNPPVVDGSEHFLAIGLPGREHPAYTPLLETLKGARFTLETSNRKWWLRDRHRVLEFLGEHWTRLEEQWGARFTENFRRHTARLRRAEIAAEVVETGAEFEVRLEVKAGEVSSEAVRAQVAAGRRYVEGEDGVFLIDAGRLAALAEAQRALAGDPVRPLLARSVHRIPRVRVAEAQAVLETVSPDLRSPAAWRERSAALRALERLAPAPVRGPLATVLRPYQRLGVAWLYRLFQDELGGVLADEMGLGKTLQALALLGSVAEPGGPAALVVAPASLLENWRREAVRFAPSLRVRVHHGPGRAAGPDELRRGADLVVTSYGTLVRDRELLAAPRWSVVVADEAQHTKNRRSQAAQALRGLSARARFALTGTPVENRLDDLRSLADFVLPGAFAPVPADARGELRAWHEARLRRQVAPFLLRRTKAQVAAELPPKIEQTIWCEASAAQRALYEQVRASTEAEIDRLAAAGRGEAQVRLAVLTQLLRLRQVCCDPRLVAPDFAATDAEGEGGSAKLQAFLELLDEAVDDGHRLLVFSQFTALLGLLRTELEAREVAYCYLDGSMTARARQTAVDRFQSDAAVPVFLISLKAGGTGLNLTGADVVVHFDPWWNPAVEAQATDRAHRLGQMRVVTSYKLVVSGTVEEKVLALQEAKRALLAGVFEESDAANARLALDELRELAR